MKILAEAACPERRPAIQRLSAIAALNDADIDRLNAAASMSRMLPARRDFVTEGEAVQEPRIVLSGWACRTHLLRDGRRQVLGFLLPGELFGTGGHANPIASASILALTQVVTCAAPAPADGGLAEAYAVNAALDEHYLLRQITRLGRLNAYERVADWLMELRERLALAGLVEGNRFPLPLTQELIADALGLTSVHVNRTIQALRSDCLLELRNGHATLLDVARLAGLTERRPARVTASYHQPIAAAG